MKKACKNKQIVVLQKSAIQKKGGNVSFKTDMNK